MRTTKEQKTRLEQIGDELEGIARSTPEWRTKDPNSNHIDPEISKLFNYAWSLKQMARKGTPSERF